MAKTKAQLLAEAEALGITIEGTPTNAEIAILIAAAGEASEPEKKKKPKKEKRATFLFEGEEHEKSANLLVWEGRNNIRIVEVLVEGRTTTDRHCRVLDEQDNNLTMHVPNNCFNHLPDPSEEEEEDDE